LARRQRLRLPLAQVNPCEPKRGSAQCAYCARNVSESLRIRCAECPDELDLCVECFSVGAETGPHKAWHAYRVVDSLAFPLLAFDWTAEEEPSLS
jgi:transcriptional adapter 2-alpha